MFPKPYTLLLSLLAAKSSGLEFHALRGSSHLAPQQQNDTKNGQKLSGPTNTNHKGRALKSKKKDTFFVATLSAESDFYPSMEGNLEFKFKDGKSKFDLSIDIKDGPKKCKDDECYITVRKATSCDKVSGSKSWSGKKLLHTDDKNIYSEDDNGDYKTGFTSNIDGKSALMFFGLDSGKDDEDYDGKIVLVHGPEDTSASSDDEDIVVIACGKIEPK